MRKYLFAAVLAAAGLCPARSDGAIVLYAADPDVGGGVPVLLATGADFTSASFTGTFGNFSITLLGASSSNGAGLSDLLKASVRVENLSRTPESLTIFASQDGYTLPAGTPLTVESGLAGTVSEGDLTGTGVFQAFADRDNVLLGTGDFTNGPQNATFSGSTFDTGSATGLFDRDADSPYSLTSVTRFQNVSAGGVGNFSDHVNVTPAAIPAPAPVPLACLTAALTGGAWWLRRRRGAA